MHINDTESDSMRKIRWSVLCIALLLLLPSISVIHSTESSVEDLLRDAHIENINGVKVLFTNGSFYELGFQHGYLLKEEVQENVRAFISYGKEIASYEKLLEMWNTVKAYIPDDYLSELQGIADGANVSLEELGVSYMIVPFIDLGCFSYASWGNATKDGKLYHVRSLDFPLIIKDPVTGKYVQENSVLIIRKLDGGKISIIPTLAGWINFYEGFNEKGIVITIQACWSSDQTLKGIPIQFRLQMALDGMDTIDDAIHVMLSNSTLGWNFIISDGKTAYIVEVTANHSYIGSWDDPIEDNAPFWRIKEVVRRTNFFIDPELAATQRKWYNPRGVMGFLTTLVGSPFFPIWRKYKAMSREIENIWGEIDLNSSISILRKVYGGKTDIVLFIFQMISRGRGILCDLHQWSYCPDTGDFAISFADSKKQSHKNELHYINIKELLDQFAS